MTMSAQLVPDNRIEPMVLTGSNADCLLQACEIVGYRSGPVDKTTGFRTAFIPEFADDALLLPDQVARQAAHYCLQEAMRGSLRLIDAYEQSLTYANYQTIFSFPEAHRVRLVEAVAQEDSKNTLRLQLASEIAARLIMANCDNSVRYLRHEDPAVLLQVKSRLTSP